MYNPSLSRRGTIYHWIGRCIAEWAKIEEEIFHICAAASGAEAKIASIMFYKTPNFDARVTLTDELLSARFPIAPGDHPCYIIKEWNSARKRIDDLKQYRNIMAHCPVKKLNKSPYEEYLMVEISKSEELRGRQKRISSISEAEIPTHFENVATLYAEINALRNRIQKI